MLVSLKDIVGCDDYYIDDTTFQIVSFKQKKYTDGKILKPRNNKDGYIFYSFYKNGKYKHIYLHHIIVKLFINPEYDPKLFEVDHKDRNPKNNSIENLAIVSHLENQRNKSSMNGVEFNYVDNIGKVLVINSDAGIYYSLDYDKFFMYINQSCKYKELHECLNNDKYLCINYKYNNKIYTLNINKFKKSLNKKQ